MNQEQITQARNILKEIRQDYDDLFYNKNSWMVNERFFLDASEHYMKLTIYMSTCRDDVKARPEILQNWQENVRPTYDAHQKMKVLFPEAGKDYDDTLTHTTPNIIPKEWLQTMPFTNTL